MLIGQLDEGVQSIIKTISEVGFAGAFCVAAYLCFWLIRARREDWREWLSRLILLQEQTNKVVVDNTMAFRQLMDTENSLCVKLADLGGVNQRLFERILERPCLIMEEDLDRVISRLEKIKEVWLERVKKNTPNKGDK